MSYLASEPTPMGDETLTLSNWALIQNPPAGDIVPPFAMQADSISIMVDEGIVTIDANLKWSGEIPTSSTKCGVACYISSANSQPGMFTQNNRLKIGVSKIIDDATEGATPSENLNFTFENTIDTSKYLPTISDFLTISLYWQDRYGRSVLGMRKESMVG
jgi:hypothetical protein